jgi:hypothetical protein
MASHTESAEKRQIEGNSFVILPYKYHMNIAEQAKGERGIEGINRACLSGYKRDWKKRAFKAICFLIYARCHDEG